MFRIFSSLQKVFLLDKTGKLKLYIHMNKNLTFLLLLPSYLH